MNYMISRNIELKGHIIDSLILPRVFEKIMDLNGEFNVIKFDIGKHKTDESHAILEVIGKNENHLDDIIRELHVFGAFEVKPKEIKIEQVQKDRVLPDFFYSTTHHPSQCFYENSWIEVQNPEMDCAIVVNKEEKSAKCVKISNIKKGDNVIIGIDGIRVNPPPRSRKKEVFEFMSSDVSTEKPLHYLIKNIAKEIKKAKGGVVVVSGPAVVHTGASDHLAELIRNGYVDVFFGGNAVAVHDIEHSLFGTSLGVHIETAEVKKGGHSHHLYAINEIRKLGSIKEAVKSGLLKKGIMYECINKSIPFVLAGSIRDDGPLPEVITDVMEAQNEMRKLLKGAKLVLMLSTMLHSIAVGNMLPSTVKTICIDINPTTVTKLMDRGSQQTLGLVTDVSSFLFLLKSMLITN